MNWKEQICLRVRIQISRKKVLLVEGSCYYERYRSDAHDFYGHLMQKEKGKNTSILERKLFNFTFLDFLSQ